MFQGQRLSLLLWDSMPLHELLILYEVRRSVRWGLLLDQGQAGNTQRKRRTRPKDSLCRSVVGIEGLSSLQERAPLLILIRVQPELAQDEVGLQAMGQILKDTLA